MIDSEVLPTRSSLSTKMIASQLIRSAWIVASGAQFASRGSHRIRRVLQRMKLTWEIRDWCTWTGALGALAGRTRERGSATVGSLQENLALCCMWESEAFFQ